MSQAYTRVHKVSFRRGEIFVNGKKTLIPDEGGLDAALATLPKPPEQLTVDTDAGQWQ